MKLAPAEHFTWLVLRRVKSGRVARSGSAYFDHGRPMGGFLAEIVAELLQQGLLELGEPSPEDCLARARLTEAGAREYATLCKRQRSAPPVVGAEA